MLHEKIWCHFLPLLLLALAPNLSAHQMTEQTGECITPESPINPWEHKPA
jgi:hypothetical protein